MLRNFETAWDWPAKLPHLTGAAALTAIERGTRRLVEEAHVVLAYLLAAVVVVRIAGALRHHVVKKNDVLRRTF